MYNTENSLQQRTGQVDTPNVSNIQSGSAQLYQQSNQGLQSTNSQLLNSPGNTQIIVPVVEPAASQNTPQQTTNSLNLGWVFAVSLLLVVVAAILVFKLATKNKSPNDFVASDEMPVEPEVIVEKPATSPKKKTRKKSKKKKKK